MDKNRTNLPTPGTGSESDVQDPPKRFVTDKPVIEGTIVQDPRKDLRVPDPESIGLRQDIGARNPYALAELIHARTEKCPIVWIEGDFDYNRNLLQDLLRCDYTRLFDPVFGLSPLFPSPVYAKIGINPEIALLAAKTNYAKPTSKLGKPAVKIPLNDLVKPQKLMQAVIQPDTVKAPEKDDAGGPQVDGSVHAEDSPCTDTGHHWGLYKIPGTQTPAYYCRKSTGQRPEVIDDIVQGCSKSCYFIAALASNAWCKYNADFPANVDMAYYSGRLKNNYTFRFYDPVDGWREVTTGSDLVLNQAGTDLVFTRPSASREVWHALYEKAYAVFRALGPSNLPYDPAYQNYQRPNLPEFSGGNPVTALRNITGAAYESFQTRLPTPEVPTPSFDIINPKITWKDSTQGVTSLPMAAWSFISSAAAKAAHGQNISYGTELIVANHSYSILGAYKTGTSKYVVLRNPYGRLWGVDPDDASLANYLYKGAWYPAADFNRTLSSADGIFALRADKFELYFQGFGWVNG